MTHEFLKILDGCKSFQEKNIDTVLATIVSVKGSSYRKEGTRMLIAENGETIGNISGGCIEKAAQTCAKSIFKNGMPILMTYDGRIRLGCEGTVYILLEKINFALKTIQTITQSITERKSLSSRTYFSLDGNLKNTGTIIYLANNSPIQVNPTTAIDCKLPCLETKIEIHFQLLVFGAEHDAITLSNIASNLGWNIKLICPPQKIVPPGLLDPKIEILYKAPQEIAATLSFDSQTAIVLMNHNYSKDYAFLKELYQQPVCYLGILGNTKRKENLLNDLIGIDPFIEPLSLEKIKGPAGLKIDAQTPEEIAISIIAEIINTQKNSQSLKATQTTLYNAE